MSSKSKMYEAHMSVHEARKFGDLIAQPCEKCGKLEAIAHHEDYSKPLDVIWLCRSCHAIRHNTLGWGATRPGKGAQFDRTSITLPPELLKLGQDMARRDNRSLSSFIAQLIADKAKAWEAAR